MSVKAADRVSVGEVAELSELSDLLSRSVGSEAVFAAFPASPHRKHPASRLRARHHGSSRKTARPSRQRSRTRDRGWILARDLPRSPKADGVRADLLERLRQHYQDDILPRGGRGIFYDLRRHGIAYRTRRLA